VSPAAKPGAAEGKFAVEAILFVDMVGSTAMGSRYGDDYVLQLKGRLADLVEAEANKQAVLFSKGTGDGFMLTFPESINAVHAAVGIMKGTEEINQGLPDARSAHLRMGVHFGQINIIAGNDRIGTAANFAARLEAAKPAQLKAAEDPTKEIAIPEFNRIFVSEVVVDELKDTGEFDFRMLGYFEFKGISGLHKVFLLLLD